jgi:hypothetical protein
VLLHLSGAKIHFTKVWKQTADARPRILKTPRPTNRSPAPVLLSRRERHYPRRPRDRAGNCSGQLCRSSSSRLELSRFLARRKTYQFGWFELKTPTGGTAFWVLSVPRAEARPRLHEAQRRNWNQVRVVGIIGCRDHEGLLNSSQTNLFGDVDAALPCMFLQSAPSQIPRR